MPPSSAAVRMTSWGFSLGGEQGLGAGFASEVETVAGARLLNPRIWSLQDNGRVDEAVATGYEIVINLFERKEDEVAKKAYVWMETLSRSPDATSI
ncbi:hypothetical protein ACFX13_005669 [Malus domestica]